jgi:hypothetical protein
MAVLGYTMRVVTGFAGTDWGTATIGPVGWDSADNDELQSSAVSIAAAEEGNFVGTWPGWKIINTDGDVGFEFDCDGGDLEDATAGLLEITIFYSAL